MGVKPNFNFASSPLHSFERLKYATETCETMTRRFSDTHHCLKRTGAHVCEREEVRRQEIARQGSREVWMWIAWVWKLQYKCVEGELKVLPPPQYIWNTNLWQLKRRACAPSPPVTSQPYFRFLSVLEYSLRVLVDGPYRRNEQRGRIGKTMRTLVEQVSTLTWTRGSVRKRGIPFAHDNYHRAWMSLAILHSLNKKI